MLSKVKPSTEPFLEKIVKPIAFLPPNLITIIGIIFPLLFFFALINHNFLSALIFLLLTIFDTLDGVVARSTGRVTKFGGVLDSTFDRLADGVLISAFGFAGIMDWWLVIALIITSYLISYIRSRAELAGEGKFKLDVGIIERTERILILSVGVIFLIMGSFSMFYYLMLLLLILSTITVLHRLYTAYQLLEKTKQLQ